MCSNVICIKHGVYMLPFVGEDGSDKVICHICYAHQNPSATAELRLLADMYLSMVDAQYDMGGTVSCH